LNRVEDRHIAVIDRTRELYEPLQANIAERNARLETVQQSKGAEEFGGAMFARILLEPIEASLVNDQLRVELSDRVRAGELDAFVEVPPDAIDRGAQSNEPIRYYSLESGLSVPKGILQSALNEIIQNRRLVKVGIDPERVTDASQLVPVQSLGLVEKSAEGVMQPETKDELSAIFLPLGVMMLMFMVIFLAAQPSLESVLEEKSQRIAEVLLGSVNPFQLMLGKLLGTVAGSLTVFAIYLLGAWLMAENRGWTGMLPFYVVPWFVAFQILGVMFYGAVFMAVGASFTQLKEAQSLLLPVWLMMMLPFFVWLNVVRDPNGMLAMVLSFFPPATPSMMVLRLATGQAIPIWQLVLSIILLLLVTLVVVFIASRIFRAGLLWQGNVPKLKEILRWVVSSD
jgi:ABC-type Na+ efflux pump permease subunit